MCKNIDEITFCTCPDFNFNELKNYWVLYRFEKGKEDYIIGETMLPVQDVKTFQPIENQIVSALNSRQVFDKAIEFQDHDKLAVYLTQDQSKESFCFSFLFTESIWKSIKYCPFELSARNNFNQEGKLNVSYH